MSMIEIHAFKLNIYSSSAGSRLIMFVLLILQFNISSTYVNYFDFESFETFFSNLELDGHIDIVPLGFQLATHLGVAGVPRRATA